MSEPTNEELLARIEQLNQQLLQAQKLSSVGAIASSITHEFNNILTTVINYAKMGLRRPDDETREKAFTKILAAGQRASKITTGMLSYARKGSDRYEPNDLRVLVQDVMVLVEKDLQKYRIGVDLNIEENVIATVNASQVQQILMNLIVNARQAMQEGGRLTMTVRRNGDEGWGEIQVRDTGCGIPQDKLPKIFDPFFTTKTADENGQGGTGIGLDMCRQIIEAHEGRIRVDSTVGKGTAFTLKLPLASVVPNAA